MNSWFCDRLLKSSICLTINPDNKSVKKRSELVELSRYKKTWKEIEDEVESKSQPSDEVKRTKEFSGENSEVPQESVYTFKREINTVLTEKIISFWNCKNCKERIDITAQDPYCYPAIISKGRTVAVAWRQIYTIVKVLLI